MTKLSLSKKGFDTENGGGRRGIKDRHVGIENKDGARGIPGTVENGFLKFIGLRLASGQEVLSVVGECPISRPFVPSSENGVLKAVQIQSIIAFSARPNFFTFRVAVF